MSKQNLPDFFVFLLGWIRTAKANVSKISCCLNSQWISFYFAYIYYLDIVFSIINELSCSNMIHKYPCDTCQMSYIGSSIEQSRFRFFQHLGYTCRTESLLANPVKCSIRQHCCDNDHPIKLSSFTIVASIKMFLNLDYLNHCVNSSHIR